MQLDGKELIVHLMAKDDAKDVVAFSTVTTPPVHSVEIERPKQLPKEGNCHWCRSKPGDLFCDGWPCCFDCIELMIDRENALGENREAYSYLPLPAEWEK